MNKIKRFFDDLTSFPLVLVLVCFFGLCVFALK